MTIEEQIRAAKERTLRAFQKISEFELREAQTDLQEFYADNMHSATTTNHKVRIVAAKTKSGKLSKTKKINKLIPLKNETDKLYVLYGKLMRALQPKQKGNIATIDKSDDLVTMSVGIDLEVVPYARIHEFGGDTGRDKATKLPARPYFFPAFERYSAERSDERVARIVDKLIKVWNKA